MTDNPIMVEIREALAKVELHRRTIVCSPAMESTIREAVTRLDFLTIPPRIEVNTVLKDNEAYILNAIPMFFPNSDEPRSEDRGSSQDPSARKARS